MKDKYDAIVIGGGYFGCSASYYLSRSGVSTLLIERGEAACGASGANFGNVQVQDSNMGLSFKLTVEGFRMMQNMEKELSCSIGYRPCPSLIVAEKDEYVPSLQEMYRAKKEAGLDIRWLNEKEVNEAEPYLAKGAVIAATSFDQGIIYPFDYIYALLQRARENGLETAEHTEVKSLLIEGGACKGVVLSDDTAIRSENVIVAAGTGTSGICATAGLEVHVHSVKAECFVTEAIQPFLNHYYSSAAFFAEAHGSNEASTSLCISQSHYGNLLIAETTKPYDIVKQEYSDCTSIEHCKNIEKLISRYFPSLNSIKILRSWTVASPSTPDYNPVLGKTRVPGLIVDAGFKSAVVMSAVSGSIVADLVAKGTCKYDISELTACCR